jgi:hypothetical protein
MSSFYIVSPRKVAAGVTGQDFVTSLRIGGDILINDIYFQSGNGTLQITTSGNYIDFSVDTNQFVSKTGDVFTGNLIFQPTAGNVGLVLHHSTTNPASTEVGGLYFNSFSNTIKIYNGAAWVDVAQVGALTISEANSTFLKLTGGTLTGNLVLNNSKLKLGNYVADPSGTVGDLIFRSDLNAIKVYTSSGWSELAIGNLSVRGGSGIKANGVTGGSYIPTGQVTFAIDFTSNYTWTGNQTFNGSSIQFGNAVSFATSQTFEISQLNDASETNGALIYYNGSSSTWTVLGPGTANQVLKVDPTTSRPAWGTNTGGTIGTPTDTDYTDGYFETWTSSTSVADAFDDVSELLKLIAPDKPGLLTSTSLSKTSGPSTYSAKLSSGLTNYWYYTNSGTSSAGATITNYIINGGPLRLDTADNSTRFYAGKANTTSTYGTSYHKLYAYNPTSAAVVATTNATYSLSAGTGSSGSLTISSLAVYNSIWEKANAYITYTHSDDGWKGHSINHTLSGETNVSGFYFDSYSSTSSTPSFSTSPSITEDTPVTKWLSGIKYYGNGSTFALGFKGASGIFNRCYHATSVSIIHGVGMNNLTVNPSSTPTYTDVFDVTATGIGPAAVTLNSANQVSNDRELSVTLFKAHGTSIGSDGTYTETVALIRGVNTYTSDPATNTIEYFKGETYRLQENSNSSFNSQTGMADGYLQVRNGVLTYPVAADYDSPSTLPYNTSPRLTFAGSQKYERFFYNEFASSIILTITGLSNVATDIEAYQTGSVNLIAQIYDLNNPGTALYYDLGQNFQSTPLVQTFEGNTLYGARVSSTSNSITFSFGVQNTQSSGVSPNYGKYRLIAIFNDDTKTITQITSATGA